MWISAIAAAACLAGQCALPTAEDRALATDEAVAIAERIDALVGEHWQRTGVQPAAVCDDATFLRRVTLDLAGRVPTLQESRDFAANGSPDKRRAAVRRLIAGPEFPLHWSNVLDEVIQGRHAGDREFIAWLRRELEAGATWEQLFRRVLVGPWDQPEQEVAIRFVLRRLNSLDDLTNDTARAFFGVDISCAKCHDHPLVDDWKQHHYYGMKSFFSRSHEGRDGKPPVAESEAGEVTFIDVGGANHTARMMFLSGAEVADPKLGLDPRLVERRAAATEAGNYVPPPFSPREELVRVALSDRRFFSRAIANRAWAFLFGRGLVHPVEQMHSQNPPSIPGVLEHLGDDLTEHGYRLDRLVAGIVLSQAYQRDSLWDSAAEPPPPESFARAQVRPLTHVEYALSAVIAAGDESFAQSADEGRRAAWIDRENHAYGLAESFDRRRDAFQSSTTEALFVSNNPRVQQLAAPAGGNLAGRLAALSTADEIVETVVWTVLSRAPSDEERTALREFLEQGSSDTATTDRAARCGHLVWALLASAEFRFKH
jgi:hypothetical protein